jgi:hypothetical protein
MNSESMLLAVPTKQESAFFHLKNSYVWINRSLGTQYLKQEIGVPTAEYLQNTQTMCPVKYLQTAGMGYYRTKYAKRQQ